MDDVTPPATATPGTNPAAWSRAYEIEKANIRLQQEVLERRHAETLKDEFVSTVSHELRTPLAITREGIALLLDGIPDPITPKQREILLTAKNNIDRLTRIINDLLDISKIEAGKMEMKKACVDFVALAEGVVASLAGAARQKGLTLSTAWTLNAREVYADPDRVVQVLTNLVNNAIKFTAQGSVTVSAVNRSDGVECAVTDTGIGLSRLDALRVFDKFTQFGRLEGAGDRGTGLGLAIARQIVDLHRGRIWVESEPERGSRFAFTLPLYSEAEVVRETVEGAISDAHVMKESFLLLLFAIIDPRAGESAERGKQFAEGFRRLRAMQHLARATDRMALRGENQVVMAARVSLTQLGALYRRWKLQVESCFKQVDPALDVMLSCGYARFPEDGSGGEALLQHAERTLSPLDGDASLSALRAGGERDP